MEAALPSVAVEVAMWVVRCGEGLGGVQGQVVDPARAGGEAALRMWVWDLCVRVALRVVRRVA